MSNSGAGHLAAPIEESQELLGFCDQLNRYVSTGNGADELAAAASSLAAAARLRRLHPESVLSAINRIGCRHPSRGTVDEELAYSRRDSEGVRMFLLAYFESGPCPTG